MFDLFVSLWIDFWLYWIACLVGLLVCYACFLFATVIIFDFILFVSFSINIDFVGF